MVTVMVTVMVMVMVMVNDITRLLDETNVDQWERTSGE